jgi:uncharacterized protein (DUF2062 family)
MMQIPPSTSLLSDRIRITQVKALEWLKCGIAPRQLAFTLALGFAIGCIPLLGVTTAICALLAMLLRLNMPAIQAANWLAMPLQVVLLIPFLRLGQWLFAGYAISFSRKDLLSRLEAAPWDALLQMSSLFGHALLAWLITAGPALLLMTLLLTPLMHRVSKLAAAEVAGD